MKDRMGSRCPDKELNELDKRSGFAIGTAFCAGGELEISAESGRCRSAGCDEMLEALLLQEEKPGMGEDMIKKKGSS